MRTLKVDARTWLLLILCVGFALRAFFFVGMTQWDDFCYTQVAYNVADGKFSFSEGLLYSAFRMGLILPTALSFKLFGVNEYATELWPLLCSLGSIVLIFCLGRLLFDQKTGLLAAFLLSFFPLNVVYATLLLPDVIQPFFFALSAVFFFRAEKAEAPKSAWFNFFISGVIAGAAFWIRESSYMILLVYMVYLIYSRSLRKEQLAIVVGLLTVFAFDLLFYFWKVGNPLLHLQVLFDTANITPGSFSWRIRHFFSTRFDFYQIYTSNGVFMFFSFFIFISTIYLLTKKDKKAYPPIIWFLTLFSYLEFMWPLHSRKLDRYLSILTIPTLLVLAQFLSTVGREWKDRWKGRLFLLTVLSVLLPTSLAVARNLSHHYRNYTADCKAAAHFLKTLPAREIYLPDERLYVPGTKIPVPGGPLWLCRFNFYLAYETSYDCFGTAEENRNSILRTLEGVENTQLQDAYVVIDSDAGVPYYWQELKELGDVTVYYTAE